MPTFCWGNKSIWWLYCRLISYLRQLSSTSLQPPKSYWQFICSFADMVIYIYSSKKGFCNKSHESHLLCHWFSIRCSPIWSVWTIVLQLLSHRIYVWLVFLPTQKKKTIENKKQHTTPKADYTITSIIDIDPWRKFFFREQTARRVLSQQNPDFSLWIKTQLKVNTLQGTNISPKNGILKMIFLFPRWDMLISRRVDIPYRSWFNWIATYPNSR